MPGPFAQSGALLCPSQSARRSPVPQRCLTCTRLSWPPQTFSLHIGADLKLPTPNARRHSSYEVAPAAVPAAAAASDPFAGLPFRAMAERLGAAMSPVVQAVSPRHLTLHAAATPCTARAVFMQTPNMHSIWFSAGGSGAALLAGLMRRTLQVCRFSPLELYSDRSTLPGSLPPLPSPLMGKSAGARCGRTLVPSGSGKQACWTSQRQNLRRPTSPTSFPSLAGALPIMLLPIYLFHLLLV